MKKTKKILVVLLAVVMFCQTFIPMLTITAGAAEEDLAYSNVWNDLQASASFKAEYAAGEYPLMPKEYKLEVITIAESEAGELFIYVYQPSGQAANIHAASIDISFTERNDEKEFTNYGLTFVNSYGVFFKYKVEGLKVSSAETRYYEISDILRPWSESYGDKKPGGGNTVSEVAYPVGKFFTFSGKSMQKVEDIEYITITEQYLGFVRYERDTPLSWLINKVNSIDAHFIAFSTDKDIDNLLEVSLIFQSRYVEFLDKDPSVNFAGKPSDRRVVIDIKDKQYLDLADGSVFTKQPLIRNRIQETSDFLKEDLTYFYFGSFEQHEKVDFKDEALLKLKQTKWVVSFAETQIIDVPDTAYTQFQQIGNVKVMRLKFETDGQIYNLGVVSNKQTGSKDPAAVVEKEEWWQKIMMLLMLILLLVALMFIWPIVSPVFRIIGIGIKNIFKILIWILMLPSKLFRKIFKLSDKYQSKRRKTSIQNTKGKTKK